MIKSRVFSLLYSIPITTCSTARIDFWRFPLLRGTDSLVLFRHSIHTNMTEDKSVTDHQARSSIQLNGTREYAKSEVSARSRSLAISEREDQPNIRNSYRPFILGKAVDWVSDLELDLVMDMAERNIHETGERLKILVLYGSLRRFHFPRAILCLLSFGLIVGGVPCQVILSSSRIRSCSNPFSARM